MRALLLHDAGPAVVVMLERHRAAGLDVVWCPVGDRTRYAELLGGAEVLLHVLDPVTDAVLEAGPRLRLVQKLGVGVNTIDLVAARRRGVAVANMPGVNTEAVAEHALGLVLAVLRRITTHHEATRAGRGWAMDPALADELGEIAGRTVGLVGYGSVARRLETVLAALGATVLHTSRQPDGPAWRTLDELVAEADVVSLHVPLTDETVGLLSAERIGALPPGAIVVNTARGGIVDQAALVAALASGRLRGAGLDVFVDEPIAPGDPILALDNVVLTPHVAWSSVETMGRCLDLAAENCRRLAAGEPLLHRVV